jgi:hypothetical protein
VVVVKSAEHGETADRTRVLRGTRKGLLLAESLVRAGLVIESDELGAEATVVQHET